VHKRNDGGELKKLYEVKVKKLPGCSFCTKEAVYDGRTILGFWAYMCEECWKVYGVGEGLGAGQRLILEGGHGYEN